MRHPAEFYIKHLIVKLGYPVDNAPILHAIEQAGFLSPDPNYLGFLRQELEPVPLMFDPANKLHRPSMQYLRQQGIYELFWPTSAVTDAFDILTDPEKRIVVEQVLLARLDLKHSAQRLNKKHGWFLTEESLGAFRQFFWNVKLLTFDEWGRFLFGRSAMYERYMGLLTADPRLALFHLRLEQQVESKNMLQRAQEIAYFTLEEVALKPGTGPDKVKAVGVLTKSIVDCHEALSTSDMALRDVLKQFERFRMEHPLVPPPDIKQLAPKGNFSGSGADIKPAAMPAEDSH